MRRVTVLVAEDHPLMIEAIKIVLAESEDFDVVGVAESGTEVAGLVEQVQPDLVLLDLSLPDVHGLDIVRSLSASKSPAQVVIFSAHEEPELIDAALRGGASAFITKRIDPRDLPAALRQALEPTLFRPTQQTVLVNGSAAPVELTERELEVLNALTDGLSNKAIGKRLWLSEQTVKFHLTSIYRKLGVSSRTEAIGTAYRRRLATSHPAGEPAAGPGAAKLA
jgi:two-component system, NarL family, response regulator DegU